MEKRELVKRGDKMAKKFKSGDDYFTMAISSPRKRCPKCGHITGGTRFARARAGDKSKWGRLKKRCKPTGRVKGKIKGKEGKIDG